MRKALSTFMAPASALSLSSAAGGTVIRVPLDQPTIQAGINSSASGDTVLVAGGTYSGTGNRDIEFGGRSVVLKSENGAAATIIDAGGTAS